MKRPFGCDSPNQLGFVDDLLLVIDEKPGVMPNVLPTKRIPNGKHTA
jgi:hypothetical protein